MSHDGTVLKEFDEQFARFKKEHRLQVGLDELDETFFVKDFILSSGFVSSHLGRQISTRLADTLIGWNHYLHTLVMPNPSDMIQMNESKLFSSTEKQEVLKLISSAMRFVSANAKLTLEPDAKQEAAFIDEVFLFWKKFYQPRLLGFIEKVYLGWKK